MPKNQKKYQLKLPSQSDNLSIIRELVTKVANSVGFSGDDISKIELAVDEACANVIKHAYGQNSDQIIDIVIKIDSKKMVVEVSDKGKGFAPESLNFPNMKQYLNEMRVGGLGIYLIETLMDEVAFDVKPGVRNQVRMIKYLNKAAKGATNKKQA